ncbi:MAG: TnsA endonuclease N-terminal domain-containing protein [Candidatus Pacearchaeota archaeon]
MSKRNEFLKGKYEVQNKEKYCSTKPPVYRSSWERRLFYYLDFNQNVLKWCSECVVIPYFYSVDNKVHQYYVDAYVEIKTNNGIKKFLIEVKPYKSTLPPSKPKNRSKKRTDRYLYEQKMYIQNQDKWKAAVDFCNKKGLEFKIITEKDLWNN